MGNAWMGSEARPLYIHLCDCPLHTCGYCLQDMKGLALVLTASFHVSSCLQDMKGVTFTPDLVAERGRSRSPKGRRRRRGWEDKEGEGEQDKEVQVRGREV